MKKELAITGFQAVHVEAQYNNEICYIFGLATYTSNHIYYSMNTIADLNVGIKLLQLATE